MLKADPFVFCTNIVPGKNPAPALDMAREFGFRFVELAAIDGISEQFCVDKPLPELFRSTSKALEKRNLSCYAVSGHCDMTDETQFWRLLRKIEYAGELGAKVINTRCGPKDRYPVFLENVKKAAELAASYGMALNLESYGDIIGSASECGTVFQMLNLDNVFYNYDPGNTYRFARGNISIEDDLLHNTGPLRYFHLKDASIHDGMIWNEPIGQGVLSYPAIFAAVEKITDTLPIALEIPMGFCVRYEDLSILSTDVGLEDVQRAVAASIAFLEQHILLER